MRIPMDGQRRGWGFDVEAQAESGRAQGEASMHPFDDVNRIDVREMTRQRIQIGHGEQMVMAFGLLALGNVPKAWSGMPLAVKLRSPFEQPQLAELVRLSVEL